MMLFAIKFIVGTSVLLGFGCVQTICTTPTSGNESKESSSLLPTEEGPTELPGAEVEEVFDQFESAEEDAKPGEINGPLGKFSINPYQCISLEVSPPPMIGTTTAEEKETTYPDEEENSYPDDISGEGNDSAEKEAEISEDRSATTEKERLKGLMAINRIFPCDDELREKLGVENELHCLETQGQIFWKNTQKQVLCSGFCSTWDEAQKSCQAVKGGHLAMIHTYFDQSILRYMVQYPTLESPRDGQSICAYAWVGLTRPKSNLEVECEDWEWSDSSQLNLEMATMEEFQTEQKQKCRPEPGCGAMNSETKYKIDLYTNSMYDLKLFGYLNKDCEDKYPSFCKTLSKHLRGGKYTSTSTDATATTEISPHEQAKELGTTETSGNEPGEISTTRLPIEEGPTFMPWAEVEEILNQFESAEEDSRPRRINGPFERHSRRNHYVLSSTSSSVVSTGKPSIAGLEASPDPAEDIETEADSPLTGETETETDTNTHPGSDRETDTVTDSWTETETGSEENPSDEKTLIVHPPPVIPSLEHLRDPIAPFSCSSLKQQLAGAMGECFIHNGIIYWRNNVPQTWHLAKMNCEKVLDGDIIEFFSDDPFAEKLKAFIKVWVRYKYPRPGCWKSIQGEKNAINPASCTEKLRSICRAPVHEAPETTSTSSSTTQQRTETVSQTESTTTTEQEKSLSENENLPIYYKNKDSTFSDQENDFPSKKESLPRNIWWITVGIIAFCALLMCVSHTIHSAFLYSLAKIGLRSEPKPASSQQLKV